MNASEMSIPELEALNDRVWRDKFACAALQGMVANPNPLCWPSGKTEAARMAYDLADAMMAERGREQPAPGAPGALACVACWKGL